MDTFSVNKMDTFDLIELERIFDIKNEGGFEEQVWVADIYNEKYIVITIPFSLSFNIEFRNYLKSIGGKWNNEQKGYFFPRILDYYVVRKIQSKFPYWLFMNNLIVD